MEVRSIPVHTGKPRQGRFRMSGRKVYPRTHGETHHPIVAQTTMMGLSPYTRGNLPALLHGQILGGSIPVHTGKPPLAPDGTAYSGVYPRTHGETRHQSYFEQVNQGLSPYTRGNPPNPNTPVQSNGSIPVHTGKPADGVLRWQILRVYPRTHGETIISERSAFDI